MITRNLMLNAMNSAEMTCEAGYCVHSPALRSMAGLVHEAILEYTATCLKQDRDPMRGVFEYGLHVGYRLAQLEQVETESNPNAEIN